MTELRAQDSMVYIFSGEHCMLTNNKSVRGYEMTVRSKWNNIGLTPKKNMVKDNKEYLSRWQYALFPKPIPTVTPLLRS